MHVRLIGVSKIVLRSECERVWLFVSVWPCDGLVTCPGCTPPLARWLTLLCSPSISDAGLDDKTISKLDYDYAIGQHKKSLVTRKGITSTTMQKAWKYELIQVGAPALAVQTSNRKKHRLWSHAPVHTDKQQPCNPASHSQVIWQLNRFKYISYVCMCG